ncbi:MAG: hypothetical protein M8353_11045 [ANME-2 cluster archaeon]|nr:hypothetical protein [ANME-2 cluster archaeon]
MTPDGKITLLQMDGHLTPGELKTGLKMAQEGCRQVYEKQRQALLDHFAELQGPVEEEIETPSLEEVVKTEENVPSEDVNTATEKENNMVAGDSDEEKMDMDEDITDEVNEEDEGSPEEPDILEDDSYE